MARAACRCRASSCRSPAARGGSRSGAGCSAAPWKAQRRTTIPGKPSRSRSAITSGVIRPRSSAITRQRAELGLRRLEDGGARARQPASRPRVAGALRDRPELGEAAEVVEAGEVEERERPAQALDPPAVALARDAPPSRRAGCPSAGRAGRACRAAPPRRGRAGRARDARAGRRCPGRRRSARRRSGGRRARPRRRAAPTTRGRSEPGRRRSPPAAAQSSIQNALARRNAVRSRARDGRVGLGEEAVPGRERGGGGVGRADLVRRPERQHLPPALASCREPVDERVGVRAERAARERGRVQHDAAGSLKLHRLFEVRRALKVTEPCPHPPPSNRRPGSRSRTCARRSTADAIPSRRPTAIASTCRRRSSRTATTSSAPSSATGRPGRASGSSRRSSRSATTAGPAASSRRGSGAGSSRSRPGSTATRRCSTSSTASSPPGRPSSRASSPRRRRSSAPASWTRGARPRRSGGEGPAREDVARQAARGRRRARPRAVRRLVRALPAQLGRLQGRARRCCRSWPSSASTSSTCRRSIRSATTNRKGRNNSLTAAKGDPGSPWAIGGAEGGHDAIHPELGTLKDFDALVAARAEGRARDRARLRDPDLARPPVAEGAPGVVQPAPRRHAQVRREPAQALPGHLQRQLRLRGLARALGGAQGRGRALVPPRRPRLPRRQPAHEVGAVLGVADRRGAGRVSRTRSSSRRRSRGRR